MKVGDVYALLGMDFSQFDKDERKAEGRVQTLGGRLSNILENAFSFTLGMSFFQMLQQGFRSATSTAFGFNAQLQTAERGFTQMLGSLGNAKRFMSDLTDFSAKTPFEFPGLLESSRQMMAMQWQTERIIPDLRIVGDTLAGIGKFGSENVESVTTALGRMKMFGKVSSREMMMLVRAGIPAYDLLADEIGVTVEALRDMAEKGALPAGKAVDALLKAMDKRFGGMMNNLEDDWQGVWATIKDVVRLTIGEMSKGLFKSINEWLVGVKNMAQGFYDALKAGGIRYAIEQTFGAQAAANVGTFISALKSLWSMVSGVGRTIVTYWSTIGPLTMFVVKAFLGFRLATFVVNGAVTAMRTFTAVNLAMQGSMVKGSGLLFLISKLVSEYKYQVHQASVAWMMGGPVTVTWLARIQAAIHSVTVAFGKLFWPILLIGTLLMGGVSIWNKYNQAVQSAAQKSMTDKMARQQKDYSDAINKAAEGTDTQAEALANLGKAASSNLQSFDEFHELTKDTEGMDFGDLLSSGALAPGMPDVEMPDFDFDFDAAIAQAKADMGGFWGWLKNKATDAITTVGGWLKSAWGGIWSVIVYVTEAGWLLLKGIWNAGVELVTGIWRVLVKVWDGIWGVVVYVAEAGWMLLKGIWNAGVELVTGIWWVLVTVWEAIWGAIKYVATTVWGWLVALWGGVKDAWGAFAAWCGNLWDGVKEKWGVFKDWVGRTWDWIVDKFNNLKDTLYAHIVEPFKRAKDYVLGLIEDAKNWGKNLIQNIKDGITAKATTIKDAVSGVASTIKGWLGFSSPTKEGPGRYADQWAPNLMKMYVDGILSNVSAVQSAASTVASSLAPMTTQPSIDLSVSSSPLKDSILEALMQKEIVVGGSGKQEFSITLTLENGQALVDLLIDPINRTAKSRGYAPVFKPAN